MDNTLVAVSRRDPWPVVLLCSGTAALVAVLLDALTPGIWWPPPGIVASVVAALLLVILQGLAAIMPRQRAITMMRIGLMLPLVALADLLDCERVLTLSAARAIAPLLIGAFLIGAPAWIFLDRFAANHRHRIATTLGLALLPGVLIGFSYLLLGVCAGMETAELRQVTIIGLAIVHANLGAAIAADHRRLDAGLVLRDGRRLLGDGKTVRGTLGGLVLATLVVLPAGVSPLLGLYVGLSALLGDAAASVLKRRLQLPPGELTPLLDQWHSLIPLLVAEVVWGVLGLTPTGALLLVMATLFIQLYANTILFLLGRKREPW